MQAILSRSILVAAFFVLLLSCGHSKKDKKDAGETKPDTASSTAIATPGTANSKSTAVNTCYINEGLKYSTIINISTDGNIISGSVIAGEIGADKVQAITFKGTLDGDKLSVAFDGTPPVVGDASEWTDKPWKIKKEAGGDKLLIPFNAKNYETNAWQEMEYEFTLTPCGN